MLDRRTTKPWTHMPLQDDKALQEVLSSGPKKLWGQVAGLRSSEAARRLRLEKA